MSTRHPLGRGLRSLAVAALVLASGACLDGPFARANPHDPGAVIELTLVGGRDTLEMVGQQAFFQLVTEPVTTGYTAAWSSSTTSLLTPLGFGRFEVVALPGSVATVEIKATLGTRSVTRNVVILPAS
ncbi:MAG: hypothetical protein K8S21_02795 [Gemmatimonadetes bacterium]|nr:hypothetical protein [Gemmatimonadota bacterium]